MASANDLIAHGLQVSKMLMQRYLADLSLQEYLHRPHPQANCAAWLVGHVTLSDRSALHWLGVTDLPSLPQGFEKRFSRDEGCPQAKGFGDVSILLPLFEQHRDRLIETAKQLPTERLADLPPREHALFRNVGEWLGFLSQHTSLHAGQITIIRRSLGRPPLV